MLLLENQKPPRDQRIIDEINRYRWMESEKSGYDIGFDQAADAIEGVLDIWSTGMRRTS